jgi:CDP-glucose 4,6-dehydratase
MTSLLWHGKSVLITGVRGFLGSWLSERLLAEGATVSGLTRDLQPPSYFEWQGLTERVHVIQADCADFAGVRRAIRDSDAQYVFHLAAQTVLSAASKAPLAALEDNVRGTYCVLEAAREAHAGGAGRLQGIIAASSYNVYGKQPTLPWVEDMGLFGHYPYDASKACGDILTRMYAHTYGLPAAVTRCANLYGPGDMTLARIIPHTICSVLRGQAPVILSDGSPVRDYLYVDDAVDACLALAERIGRPDVRGEAFNFGTPQPVSVIELCREVIAAVGRDDIEPEVRSEPRQETDQQYLSCEKADRALDWRAKVLRAEGLARTVAWYRELLQAGGLP